MSTLRITAIVTAYHPDELLRGVVDSALGVCASVIVVDNTPGDAPSLAEKLDDPRVTVLGGGRNLGLAAGLNRGLAHLPADTEAVLLLDQDSVIPDGLIEGLAKVLGDPGIGIVGPSPVDADTGRNYETLAERFEQVDDRDLVITSGMLLRRSCLEKVPGFREDFFVDYVDVDFCLRMKSAGVRIVRDLSQRMPHSIGDVRTHRFLGREIRVGHHAAWRHYWTLRNGLILIREHVRAKPAWAVLNTLFLARWFVQVALFEPKRRTHVPACLKGMRDAISGRVASAYIPAGAEYHGSKG